MVIYIRSLGRMFLFSTLHRGLSDSGCETTINSEQLLILNFQIFWHYSCFLEKELYKIKLAKGAIFSSPGPWHRVVSDGLGADGERKSFRSFRWK